MPEILLLVDAASGALLVEDTNHVSPGAREALTGLLGPAQPIACAAPRQALTLPPATPGEVAAEPCVRLAGYWHDSLIEGPGRRSVAKLQGCPIRCPGCLTPDSWDTDAGTLVPVGHLADTLLDPLHERDGVTILGGEPFAQPAGLLALVRALRTRGCWHILVYSGFTYAALRQRALADAATAAVLADVDMLIDGPFVAARAAEAGPWTGSGNQRVLALRERRHSAP